MTEASPAERTRREIIRLCHAGLDARTLRVAVLARLRTVMPIDAAFFATLDPATLLFTDAVVDDALQDASPRFLDNEFLGDDVNKFALMARSETPIRTLGQATGRHLERSPRYRDILAPLALGDELRAVLRSGSLAWGSLCLHRERGKTGFTPGEARYVAGLAPYLASGLRTALVVGELAEAVEVPGPGLLVLSEDFSVVASTPMADQWLAEMPVHRSALGELPAAVYAVAARLRSIERNDQLGSNFMPRVRLRTPAGRWLLVHASRLVGAATQGQIAIFLEEARPAEIAPLILSAHQLTAREGEITQLVAQGLSTTEIAERLCITVNTVQDYLKAIFDKVGVRSRRELVAQLFAQHYLPRLVGSDAANHQRTQASA